MGSHKDVSEEFVARKFGAKPGPCYYRKSEEPAFDHLEQGNEDDSKEEKNVDDAKEDKNLDDVKERNVDILTKAIKKESKVELNLPHSATNMKCDHLKEEKPEI